MSDVLAADGQIDQHRVVSFLLGVDLEQRDLHVRQRRGDVGEERDAAFGEDGDERLVHVGGAVRRAILPMCGDKAVALLGVGLSGQHVRAVDLVDRHAVAARDEADDRIAGQRVAAACKFRHAALLAVHDDAVGRPQAAGRGQLDLIGRQLDLRLLDHAVKLVPQAHGDLGDRHTAVAEHIVEVLGVLHPDAARHVGRDLVALCLGVRSAHAVQLALDLGAAEGHVLGALLLLEPLADLVLCIAGLDDVQPVAARPLGGRGGQHLDDVAGLRLAVDRHDHAVDLGADHLVADARVNGVGKVDHRRALRQDDDIALRREDKDLVAEDVDLERIHELVGVLRVVLDLKEAGDPLQL